MPPLLEVAVRRRLVGRLDRGDELARTVRDAATRFGVTEAEVRAHGRLAWIDLMGSGPGVTERRDGPFDVVSLVGRVSVVDGEPEVTLTVHAIHASPALPPAAGRLVAAAAIALDVVVEVWDAAGAPAKAAAPAPSPREAAWAKVVEASHRRPAPPPRPEPLLPPADLPKVPPRAGIDLDEPMPEVGDDVQHPQFGRCRVVESADDKIAIRLASGRIVQLGAAVLKFGVPEIEGDRRVFPVEVRVRR